MFHLAAYTAQLATVANINMTAIQDDILTRNPNTGNFILPYDMNLFADAAMSLNLNRVEWASATLRQVNQPYIRPIIEANYPPDLVQEQNFLDQPLLLPMNEEMALLATSDVNPGPETCYALIWVGGSLDPVPPGNILTCRWTSTAAAVLGAWTTIGYTMDQTLPPGTYAMVGSEHYCVKGVAHRWIIPNQVLRPGQFSAQSTSMRASPTFTRRRMGTWGQFMNIILPQLQVLVDGTNNAHTGYMQLVKMS